MSDVSFVLSGGINNEDPNESLGGLPSPTPITDDLNNLFSNISSQEASSGKTDYRCFYVFNDGTLPLREVRVSMSSLSTEGATISLGFLFQTEEQIIRIKQTQLSGSLPPESGSFTLLVDDLVTNEIEFSSDDNTMADNIADAISDKIDDCEVEYIGTTSDGRRFKVTFNGRNDNKTFPVMTVESNEVTPTHSITVVRNQIGSPINSVAPDIGDEKIAPTDIAFTQPVSTSLSIGDLKPNDGFPVWIKRTVDVTAEAVEGDGVRFRMKSKLSSS